MSKFTKIFSGLHFPTQASPPSDPQEGDIYFDGTKLWIYVTVDSLLVKKEIH